MEDHADLVTRSASRLFQRLRGLSPEQVPAAFLAFSEDEQALFLVAGLANHGRDGLTGCGRELPHRLVSTSFWESLRGAFQRIGDADMVALIERWHAAVKPALPADGMDVSRDAVAMDQLRTRLGQLDPATMEALDADFHRLLPAALERMASHITRRGGSLRV